MLDPRVKPEDDRRVDDLSEFIVIPVLDTGIQHKKILMTRDQLLSNVWIRMLIFAWMVVFPIVFVALPAFEMFTGRTETSLAPLWAFVVWVLGPWAASILFKYFSSNRNLDL